MLNLMSRIIQSESAFIREIRGSPFLSSAASSRLRSPVVYDRTSQGNHLIFKVIQSDSNLFKVKNVKTRAFASFRIPRIAGDFTCTYLHQVAPTCRKKIWRGKTIGKTPQRVHRMRT